MKNMIILFLSFVSIVNFSSDNCDAKFDNTKFLLSIGVIGLGGTAIYFGKKYYDECKKSTQKSDEINRLIKENANLVNEICESSAEQSDKIKAKLAGLYFRQQSKMENDRKEQEELVADFVYSADLLRDVALKNIKEKNELKEQLLRR